MPSVNWRSGAEAVPYLITELREGPATDRNAVNSALVKLPAEVVPPLIAGLESNDANLQIDLIDVFLKRGSREVVPYLWPLVGNTERSAAVRQKASDALYTFLDIKPGTLLSAKEALTKEAERYYYHKVNMSRDGYGLWRWDPTAQTVVFVEMPVTEAQVKNYAASKGSTDLNAATTGLKMSKAEEYRTLWFARHALAIDPTHVPAQILLVSSTVDKTIERVGPQKPLAESAPAVHEMLTTVNPDLLIAVLDQAMEDKRTNVVLGTVRALGDVADIKATKATRSGESSLVKATTYPDRRVQWAAADSLLRIPGVPSGAAAARVVDILARGLEAETMAGTRRKVLVAMNDVRYRDLVAKSVEDIAAEPVVVGTGRDALRRLLKASDIDAILLDSTLNDPTLAYLMGQLKADARTQRVPVLLAAIPESPAGKDILNKYQTEKAKLDALELRARGYRDKRRDFQTQYEAELAGLEESLKGLRALQTVEPEDRERLIIRTRDAIKVLKDLHASNLAELARRFPEQAHTDEEAQRIEAALKLLDRRYDLEAARREDALRRAYESNTSVQVVSARRSQRSPGAPYQLEIRRRIDRYSALSRGACPICRKGNPLP